MITNANSLSVSQSSFSVLRATDKIYVDKTDLINDFASVIGGGAFFISRPRRFGKSLLVSTLESLFKDGLKDFKGLAIEKLWQDKKTYKVIKLNFAEITVFTNKEEFSVAFYEHICDAFAIADLPLIKGEFPTLSSRLKNTLAKIDDLSLVLLIDEYDSPLNRTLHNPELFSSIQNTMLGFFEIFKNSTYLAKLRSFFITGITRYQNTGIFSGFNNFTDLTLNSNYGTLLGYTEEEIEKYFSEYLTIIENKLSISHKELMEKLKINYDGFCFEETAQKHVYAPWSVLCFLRDMIQKNSESLPTEIDSNFKNYWIDTAGNTTLLMNYFKVHGIEKILAHGGDFEIDKQIFSNFIQSSLINIDVLLAQAGYFTIKKSLNDVYVMGFPNNEVAKSIVRLVFNIITNNKDLSSIGLGEIKADLETADISSVFEKLNKLMLNFAYDILKSEDQKYLNSENAVRQITQAFLTGLTKDIHSENVNAKGRCDLGFNIGSYHYAIEFKYVSQDKQADKYLNDGVKQVQDRAYGKGDTSLLKLIRLVLVYSDESKCFVKF